MPAHPWHDNIGEEKIGGTGVLFAAGGGLSAATGTDDLVACSGENVRDQFSDTRLILHQEDCRLLTPQRCRRLTWGTGCRGSIDTWQIEGECRPMPKRSIYGDVPATLRHNPIHCRQPQPPAPPHLLVGKK